jgi:hypothetical protein
MAEKGRQDASPRKVRLPGFIVADEVGLGDVMMRITSGFGVRPCGGCQRRADAINRRMVLYGSPKQRGGARRGSAVQ